MASTNVMDVAGFKFRILFYKHGYTPHYAEHVIDPRDNREKLVMADPHGTFSIIVYDTTKGIIEDEIKVSGGLIPNPHTAHMLMNRVPEINAEPGDILCSDRAGRWVLIDRDSHRIKWNLALDDSEWPHDIVLSSDGKSVIVTDYGVGGYGGFVRKVTLNSKTLWNIPMFGAAKISRIFGSTASGIHTNSFGGNYVVAQNGVLSGIYEIDEDGSIVWQCPKGIGSTNNSWLFKPHSAFRVGLAEASGNLTVVGFEAGGGIVAIDYFCRPRWGIMSTYTVYPIPYYRPSRYGLMETTHVFPTLSGTIAAVDWRGYAGSMIIELLEIPKAPLSWVLSWDLDPGPEGIWLDPPIEVLDFDSITLTLINVGDSSIKWKLYASTQPLLTEEDFNNLWHSVSAGLLDGGDVALIEVDNRVKRYAFLRLRVDRGVEGVPSKVRAIITWC
ncbi:MAG: hypothetical protein N3E36_07360 [Sulfolobales archaeon]|nr:hypothetical protein [Ignisphaera sp.]MCX8199809.1 hypothetical protein [Sulfolobales archaeon]MDW8084950.1 hypothetical protein [Ignisphaera sp.]